MTKVDVVADRFELRRLVGTGGMGEVHQAFDRISGELVAIKVLTTQAMGHPLERFRREISLLAELSDPRIVRYVAHGLTRDGRPFVAMEWLEGIELTERIVRGRLPVGETVMLARRIAEGLSVLHARGVVHRDVKPSNIFLVGGLLDAAKLLDFGVARSMIVEADARATRSGVIVGTPGYMAPEQARGESEIDARADVYALGCVIYECLAGEPLYRGTNVVAILAKILLGETPRIRETRRDVPPELEALLGRMLSRNPIERPADGGVVARELADLPGVVVEPSSPTVPPARDSRAITHTERRLVSVLLVVDAAGATFAATHASSGADETVAATMDPRLVAMQFGAEIEALADGSLVAVVTGKGTATDQAARAARCALELRKLLGVRAMALATGFASPDSLLAAREVIDRAAALLGLTHTHGVALRLDDVTAGLLDHRFAIGGDNGGLLLVGLRDEQTLPRTLLGRPMPFVGRERELQALLAVVRECDDDSCARPVLVTAGPGIGKTRLAQEFMRGVVHDDRAELWVARGDPMSEGSPFALLAQAIRAAAGIFDGESLIVRQKKLRARVARNVHESHQAMVTEFLAEIVGASFSEDASVKLRAARQDPRLMGDQMRTAFEEFVAAECGARPLVIVLEDLQWGDLPSVKFIDSVLRNLEDLPLTVVGFARPEMDELFPGLWKERNVTEIRLAPLSKRASEALVRNALGDLASPDRVARILERASGNAFFLEELIRSTADGNEEFPASVLAMVESRLERLDVEARRVLRAASVFGVGFWERGVGALLGDERARRVADWLIELQRREIVDKVASTSILGEREFAFRHSLIREAAYAMLTTEDRALGHKLAAEWLEAKRGGDPAVLAEHYERGGDRQRAVGLYSVAAAHAHEGDDFETANAHAERAIACGATGNEKARLRFIQGSGSLWAGKLEDAIRFTHEAVDTFEPSEPERFVAAGVWASAAVRMQRMDELLAVDELVSATLGGGELSAGQVVGASRVAGSLFYGGFGERADRLLACVETQGARVIGEESTAAAWVQYARSMRATTFSEPEAELQSLASAVAAFDAVGDRRNACMHRVNLGSGMQNFGLLDEAEAHLRRALADAERMGLTPLANCAKHNLGAALTRRGLFAEGIALEREAIEGFRALGDRFLEGAARGYVGTMLRVSGRLDEARAEIEQSLSFFDDVPHARAPILAALAMVEVAAGNGERALEVATAAVAASKDRGIFEGESYIRLAYAEALHVLGRAEEAREAIAGARARLLERANGIHDPSWRKAFLERVRENAQTLARAREWLGEDA